MSQVESGGQSCGLEPLTWGIWCCLTGVRELLGVVCRKTHRHRQIDTHWNWVRSGTHTHTHTHESGPGTLKGVALLCIKIETLKKISSVMLQKLVPENSSEYSCISLLGLLKQITSLLVFEKKFILSQFWS